MNITDTDLSLHIRETCIVAAETRSDKTRLQLQELVRGLIQEAVTRGWMKDPFAPASTDKYGAPDDMPKWVPQVIKLEGDESEAASNAKHFTDAQPSVHAGVVSWESRLLNPGEIEVRICGEDGQTKCWAVTTSSHRGVILRELFTMGDGYK